MKQTKKEFIKRIQKIAYHKNELQYILSGKKKKIKLEDIPDVTIIELHK